MVTKSGNFLPGRNVLVTGIGGGVALNVLQFAVAGGLRVWVTSGSQEKIEKAKEMGAEGGVSYKSEEWGKELVKLLPKDRPYIDAIIDGAGGDVVPKSLKFLKVCTCLASSGFPNVRKALANLLTTLARRSYCSIWNDCRSYDELDDGCRSEKR